jgi:hypothetical protein
VSSAACCSRLLATVWVVSTSQSSTENVLKSGSTCKKPAAVRVCSKYGGAIPRKARAISRSNSKIRATTLLEIVQHENAALAVFDILNSLRYRFNLDKRRTMPRTERTGGQAPNSALIRGCPAIEVSENAMRTDNQPLVAHV